MDHYEPKSDKRKGPLPFSLLHQDWLSVHMLHRFILIIAWMELAWMDVPGVSGFAPKMADGGQFITSINS